MLSSLFCTVALFSPMVCCFSFCTERTAKALRLILVDWCSLGPGLVLPCIPMTLDVFPVNFIVFGILNFKGVSFAKVADERVSRRSTTKLEAISWVRHTSSLYRIHCLTPLKLQCGIKLVSSPFPVQIRSSHGAMLTGDLFFCVSHFSPFHLKKSIADTQ